MTTHAHLVVVEAEWIGRSIGIGEGRSSQALRDALVFAQRAVIEPFGEQLPRTLKLGWTVQFANGDRFEWNPQNGVPKGAVYLVCTAVGT